MRLVVLGRGENASKKFGFQLNYLCTLRWWEVVSKSDRSEIRSFWTLWSWLNSFCHQQGSPIPTVSGDWGGKSSMLLLSILKSQLPKPPMWPPSQLATNFELEVESNMRTLSRGAKRLIWEWLLLSCWAGCPMISDSIVWSFAHNFRMCWTSF